MQAKSKGKEGKRNIEPKATKQFRTTGLDIRIHKFEYAIFACGKIHVALRLLTYSVVNVNNDNFHGN